MLRARGFELGFGTYRVNERAFLSDGSDLDHGAIRQTGALLRDSNGFIEGIDLKQKIAANCFFGFCKRAIGNNAPVFSRNDAPLVFQRTPRESGSLGG